MIIAALVCTLAWAADRSPLRAGEIAIVTDDRESSFDASSSASPRKISKHMRTESRVDAVSRNVKTKENEPWVAKFRMRSTVEIDIIAKLTGEYCSKMNAANMEYWLDRGTLIGAARNGAVIPYDGDGDLAVVCDDLKKARGIMGLTQVRENSSTHLRDMRENSSAHLQEDLMLHLRQCGGGYLKKIEGTDHVDMVGLDAETRDGKEFIVDHYGWGHPKLVNIEREKVFPLRDCTFAGHACKCPNDVNAYLNQQYGEDWFVPRKGDAGSEQYLTDILDNSQSMLSSAQKQELKAELERSKQGAPAKYHVQHP